MSHNRTPKWLWSVPLISVFIVYLMYDVSKKNIELHDTNQTLKNKVAILKERVQDRSKVADSVCGYNDQQGIPMVIDCGESFSPRYATCVCTTMCLADYSLVYNNLAPEDCPRYSEFTIEPHREGENEEEN